MFTERKISKLRPFISSFTRSLFIGSLNRRRPIFITLLFLILSVFFTLFLMRGRRGDIPLSSNILILTLMNINITLVMVLFLLCSRNMIKLYFEGVGAPHRTRFQTKLVSAFIGFSIIPSVILCVVAIILITSSIENGFSVLVEQSLDHALSIAQNDYERRKEEVALTNRQIGDKLIQQSLLHARPEELKQFLEIQMREHPLTALSLLTPDFKPLIQIPSHHPYEIVGPDPNRSVPLSVRSEGGEEIIRSLYPIRENGGKTTSAILVLYQTIPSIWIEKMKQIRNEWERYQQLKSFKNLIKESYILSFLIILLLILFSAVWFGRYLARSITIPIQKLAEGTKAVADGDLNFKIDLNARDELGTLVASFNRMTFDLKQGRDELIRTQKLAAWQDIAQQIAHEIKNPLTPIQLSVERLRKKYVEGSPNFSGILDESVQTVINEVHALKRLVDEFSQFARMPTPRLTLQRIDSILQEVVSLYQSGHKDLIISIFCDREAPSLHLDRDQIKRVFLNLFENASDAMNGSGRLDIKTVYDAALKQVRVEVADEGIGVLPEDQNKLFLPYFSRKKAGTGLGLAIVNRTVSDHNGKIWVTPRHPKGTTFTLLFPVEGVISKI